MEGSLVIKILLLSEKARVGQILPGENLPGIVIDSMTTLLAKILSLRWRRFPARSIHKQTVNLV